MKVKGKRSRRARTDGLGGALWRLEGHDAKAAGPTVRPHRDVGVQDLGHRVELILQLLPGEGKGDLRRPGTRAINVSA